MLQNLLSAAVMIGTLRVKFAEQYNVTDEGLSGIMLDLRS